MGVGKGTVARHIAKKTGKLFLDTDELIESEQNLKDYKIDKIYAYVLIASGAILTWLLITYWAVPYNEIKGML